MLASDKQTRRRTDGGGLHTQVTRRGGKAVRREGMHSSRKIYGDFFLPDFTRWHLLEDLGQSCARFGGEIFQNVGVLRLGVRF